MDELDFKIALQIAIGATLLYVLYHAEAVDNYLIF